MLPPIQNVDRPSVILTNNMDYKAEGENDQDMESPTASEKAFTIAKSNREIALAIMNLDHQRYNGDYLYRGLFIDFLVRCRSSLRAAEHSKALLDPPMEKDARKKDGYEIVHLEKLQARLSRLIVYHYKSRGDPAFILNVRDVKHHFWEIVEHKRQAIALNADVDNYRLIYTLKNAQGRDFKEESEVRRGRLLDFWPKYHNTHKTVDLRLAHAGTGHLPLGTGLGGGFFPRADDDVPNLSPGAPTFDSWKLRCSRHKRSWSAGRTRPDTKGKATEPDVTSNPASSPREQTPVARQVETPLPAVKPLASPPASPAASAVPSSPSRKKAVTGAGPLPPAGDLRAPLVRRQKATGPAPLVVPRSVKNALGDASLVFLGNTAPAGLRRPKPPGRAVSRTSLSSSTPNLPSMAEAKGSSPGEKPHFGGPKGKNMSVTMCKKATSSPIGLYVRACEKNCVLPNLLPFCTGDSEKLNAAGQGLSDHNLNSIVEMFVNVAAIDEVDLDANASLTERSLVPFIKQLMGKCAKSRLERFSLSHCLRNATGPGIQEVVDNLTSLISTGVHKLQKLDLSGIPIGLKSHLPLCEAIAGHLELHTVALADVGLGKNPQVLLCLNELMNSGSITELDIGWNSFTKQMFEHLGKRFIGSGIIRKLNVSNCAKAATHGNNPVEYFLECLAHVKGLTDLDISFNRIDFRGALVLEAAMEKNVHIEYLNISHNPLHTLGFRSLLRLLARETSGLMHFNCENCWAGALTQAAEEGFQVFSATNPGGRYVLNLTRPYHRALLTTLYKTCERFNMEPYQAFARAATLSPPSFIHASKNSEGVWIVPTEGSVDITFSVESYMEKALQGVPDGDFALFLERHYAAMRVTPDRRKTVPLFAQWKEIDGLQVDQLTMLDAMSKDFLFNYSQFVQMCRSRAIIGDIVWRILPCVTGGTTSRYLGMLHMPSIGEYLKLMRRSVRLLHFNIDNPTGHYNLDLSNCCDFAIAERLMLLDRWECSVARRKDLEDVSQRGVRCQVRNELYQGKQLFGVACIAEFNMPEYGSLEFDYISSKRPPKDALPIGQDTWDEVLLALQHSVCSTLDQIEAVTMISHYFFFTALQMRELTGIFKETAIRCEFLVRLFLRLTDMHNEKIFRARFEDPVEFARVQNRLGHATFFPFIQPEQSVFELDFGIYDQRLAAHFLLTITAKEARDNLREYNYTHADGTVDHFVSGIPRTWDFFDRIPKEGVFRAKYNSAPEDRDFGERCRLLQKYGFWAPPADADVMWWSSISECPLDVVEFVEFLFTKYKGIWKAFKIIDGPDGNGQITLREFEEGIEEMKCTKFNGKNKSERITNVFRYLDPSGEGQVSEGEWGVLDQLLSEIKLSIKEFVDFCERTFGEDLMYAWHALDADKSGEIDEDEWKQACQECGFFGLTEPIFNFLDLDDEGTVSPEEFALLEVFQTKKKRKKEGLDESPPASAGK